MSDCVETTEGGTRRIATMSTIIRQLCAAQRWLTDQRTYTQDAYDKTRRLIIGCVYLLSQSETSYNAWVERNAERVKGLHTARENNKAIRRLCELTISDLEACTWKRYLPPWQLSEWPTRGELKTCEPCGNAYFGPRKFCSRECAKLANKPNRYRKSA